MPSLSENTGRMEHVAHGLAAEVELWRLDLDAYADEVVLDGLGPDDYARAARMTFEPDARRLLASRHALRQILAGALNRSPGSLVIEADGFGKPCLAERGAIHFNLSHSGAECLIGLSREWAIGVDVEVVRPVAEMAGLVEEHFTGTEQQEWGALAEPLRGRAFLVCWTRKEACLKALGIGLSGEASSIEVGCVANSRVVTVPFAQDRCEVTLQSLDLSGAVVGAVALACPDASARIAMLAPESR